MLNALFVVGRVPRVVVENEVLYVVEFKRMVEGTGRHQ